jgi:hypothetical protein
MRYGWSSRVLLLLLTACGGGGGEGGGALPALTYSGSTSQATVSTTNASRLTANILGSGDAAGIIGGASLEGGSSPSEAGGGVLSSTRRLARISRDTLVRVHQATVAGRPVAGVIPIDETVLCDSGSARIFGTLADDGTGTLAISYSDCRFGDETVNGQGTVRVDVFDLVLGPTDFTVSFSRATIRGTGISVDGGGSLRVQLFVPGPNSETLTSNLVTLDNLTGVMTLAENLVFENTYDDIFFPSSIASATVTGRIYDNANGFVDVTTLVLLAFGTLTQLFPDSGTVLLAGNGTAVVVTALSSTRVRLQFDTNGDSVGDGFSALMNWTDLSGPIGADIGDTPDGDGMHTSWETFYGLDPSNNADATADNDAADGDNLAEYQAGTDPNVAGM